MRSWCLHSISPAFFRPIPPRLAAARKVPTTILARIKEGEKKAAETNDTPRLWVLRGLLADIAEAEKRRYPPRMVNCDSDVVHLIHKAIAKRNEVIAMYREGGREDLVVEEEAEGAIIKDLLPPQLATKEVDEIVLQTCVDVGATSFKHFNHVLRTVPISPTRAPKAKIVAAAGRYINNPEKYGVRERTAVTHSNKFSSA
ncbi:MAG: Yqey-like protein-domain-containing protein [Olpidium bornovanus]|uniref:Altered inheritance of mitochondria protein 41 n=1 Tax=Olpidium bornovanus TaxID=278681 RepID=A0A8H7ZXP5_9FUNG|nr:MAG: Yqey-like protein-domain-containing protein [Olpidium bornovanus]